MHTDRSTHPAFAAPSTEARRARRASVAVLLASLTWLSACSAFVPKEAQPFAMTFRSDGTCECGRDG